MVNRLSANEAMYYFLDESASTSHLGALLILDPETSETVRPARGARSKAAKKAANSTAAGTPNTTLDYSSLVRLVEDRLPLAPRYRQLVKPVTMGLARPVWVDDPDFDINFHIRRSGLPKPGTMADLLDLVSRVLSRPLDRSRPLWEMYLIEGLADGQLALFTKTHRCILDDADGVEISEIIAQERGVEPDLGEDLWMPDTPPGGVSLVVGALTEALARPGDLVEAVLRGNETIADARGLVSGVAQRAGEVVKLLAASTPSSPLNNSSSSSRLFTTATVSRRGCVEIAERFDCSVNDVELAIISGTMRRWLQSLGDGVGSPGDTVRVELPLSARDATVARGRPESGDWVIVGRPTFVTDLPVGEDNPSIRLTQVAGLANRYAQAGRRINMGARPMFGELGVVPFPEFSSRAFRSLSRRGYNVPISMALAPVADRFVLGHRATQIYGVPTLVAGRALAISVVDYGTELHFAFIADRAVVADLPDMVDYVGEAYDELRSS